MTLNQTSGHLGRILPLLTLALAMVVSDPWFTHVDDEVAMINDAAHPAWQTINLFLRGIGQHEHPPLYDLLLHGWLRLTGGEMRLLRLPSILFFVAGLWALAEAAGQIAGPSSAKALLWMGMLWPYGFHFGRLAAWYSFSFFLVAMLTLAYLKFLEEQELYRWLWLFIVSIALVYTNYFGWALLLCLGADFWLQRRPDMVNQRLGLLVTGVLLLLAYWPLWPAFLAQVSRGAGLKHSVLSAAINLGFSLYVLFASESVAPWFWELSVLVGVAVTVCIVWTALFPPGPARRFLLYFLLLDAAIVGLGLFTTKRLMLIAAWLLLPLAITMTTLHLKHYRRWFAASLAVIAGVGWYGIFSCQLYAAPRFIEPWPEVAQQAAQRIREGAVVIGNNPSFFFYLTYALRPGSESSKWRFSGCLPKTVQDSRVYEPEQWANSGHSIGSTTLLVKGVHFGTPAGPTEYTQHWLDENCRLQNVRRMMPDSGFRLKQRYFPELEQPPWRIEIREYACAEARPTS